jgi:hypothetical protein
LGEVIDGFFQRVIHGYVEQLQVSRFFETSVHAILNEKKGIVKRGGVRQNRLNNLSCLSNLQRRFYTRRTRKNTHWFSFVFNFALFAALAVKVFIK